MGYNPFNSVPLRPRTITRAAAGPAADFHRGRYRRWCHTILGQRRGSSVVEFALIAPILTIIIFATAEFGIYLANYIQLTNAVAAGARQLAVSRPASTPYTTARSAVTTAAPGLRTTDMVITILVGGTACTSDSACRTSLGNNIGGSATVRATYPCSLPIIGWTSGCSLVSQSSQAVQ